MKVRIKILLMCFLLGILIIFFLPVFPIPLKQTNGHYSFNNFPSELIFWNSGLMQLEISSVKNLVLLELIGGLTGFVIPFLYFSIKDYKKIKDG